MIDSIGDIFALLSILFVGTVVVGGFVIGFIVERKETLQTIRFGVLYFLGGLALLAPGIIFPRYYLLLTAILGLIILVKVARATPAFLRAAFADGTERGWERLLAVAGMLAILVFIGWIGVWIGRLNN